MFGVQTLRVAVALVVVVLVGKTVEVLALRLERQWRTMSVDKVAELVQLVAVVLLVAEAEVVLVLLGQTEQRQSAVLEVLGMMSQRSLLAVRYSSRQVEEVEVQQQAVLEVLLSAVLVVQMLLEQMHPQILLLAAVALVVEQLEQGVTAVQESSTFVVESQDLL